MMTGAAGAKHTLADCSTEAPQLVGPDAARLSALVESYFDFAWRSLRRLGVAEAQVDDATQQLFMVVARRLPSIAQQHERSFVFGAAVRIAAAHRRSQRRQPEPYPEDSTDTGAIDPTPSPEELLDMKRARHLLDTILDRLPMELRAALVLAEGDGMSRREIGELFGIPEGTAGSRLRRARVAFEAELARYLNRQGECP
ncbi:MAG TPA: RNA polymerase sigma factor [Polyangiaceae bacterium]